jgi:hypothetical protein
MKTSVRVIDQALVTAQRPAGLARKKIILSFYKSWE